ncbi:hypothetical protein BX600DRAFT_469713, partial [Xylariales sp. PMI_506]
MFFVYGDPESGEAPTVSIRTTSAHNPKHVSASEMGGADVQIMESAWVSRAVNYQDGALTPRLKTGVYTAQVSLACYSCALWSGATLSTTASSQSWI